MSTILNRERGLAITEAWGVLNFWIFSTNFSLANVLRKALIFWHSRARYSYKKMFTRDSFTFAIPFPLRLIKNPHLKTSLHSYYQISSRYTVQVFVLLEEEPLWKNFSLISFVLSMTILLGMLPVSIVPSEVINNSRSIRACLPDHWSIQKLTQEFFSLK